MLPDDRPPRLSEEAKTAIRRLAMHLRAAQLNPETIYPNYPAARELAGEESEPRLMYGLLLLRARDRNDTAPHFEELSLERPGLLLPLQGIAWMQFDLRRYPTGVTQLAELVGRIPVPEDGEEYDAHALSVFMWAGRLREFAASAVPDAWQGAGQPLDRLDAAVAGHGLDARKAFEQGAAAVRKIIADFDRRIAAADGDATAARLRIDRRQLADYATLPFDNEASRILAGLRGM